MADQNSRQDENQYNALLAHTGTAGTAETVRVVANSSGALNANVTGGTVNTSSPSYITFIDETTTTSVTYVGKAVTGSSGTSAVWQIKSIDETGSGTTLIKYAGTTTSFNQVWNSRSSLGYG